MCCTGFHSFLFYSAIVAVIVGFIYISSESYSPCNPKYKSSPYSFDDTMLTIWRTIFGWSDDNEDIISPLPQTNTLNGNPSIVNTLCFFGDIIGTDKVESYVFGTSLSMLMVDCDAVIFTLEGMVGDQIPTFQMEQLERFIDPTKTILNVASNKQATVSDASFDLGIDWLQVRGYTVATGPDPVTLTSVPGVTFYAATDLWDGCIDGTEPVGMLSDLPTPDSSSYNIVLPHWGVAYETWPRSEELTRSEELLSSGYDLIVGSHTHSPQPVSLSACSGGATQCAIAWSLGNFMTGQKDRLVTRNGLGRMLKVGVGVLNGDSVASSVSWEFVSSTRSGTTLTIELK